MSEVSETDVSPRIAVAMVVAKSGESMAFAMFSEPRLQEMSRPGWAWLRAMFIVDGVETCRISEHRFEEVSLPAVGVARVRVASSMTYGEPGAKRGAVRSGEESR